MFAMIFSIIFFIFFISLECSAQFMRKSDTEFYKSCKTGPAVVVNYYSNNRNSAPLIKILDIDDNKEYLCNFWRKKRVYQIGATIDVVYGPYNFLGTKMIKVYPAEHKPASLTKCATFFRITGLLCLIAAIILLFIGITTF